MNKYTKISNLHELKEFTRTEEFTNNMVYEIFKYLGNMRKLEDLDINKLFKKINASWVNDIYLPDSFISANRLLLSSAFSVLEKSIGQELISNVSYYEDILKFQKTLRICKEYLTTAGMNFFGIDKPDENYTNFLEHQASLVVYIKLFCTNEYCKHLKDEN